MQKLQGNLSSVFTDQICLFLHLLCGDLSVFPDDENLTLSRNFFSIHTTEGEFIKVAGKNQVHFPFVYHHMATKSSYFPTGITQRHRTSLICMALAVRFRKKNPCAVWNAQLLGTRVRKNPACREH